MPTRPIGPIRHEYELTCTAEHAFEVYTRRIGEWWHPAYSPNPETLEAVEIEPGVGGRVLFKHRGEGQFSWGQVTEWQPPRRLSHTSVLAQPSDHPTQISVDFAPQGAGCRIQFEHGGWNDGNVSVRQKFSDWQLILDRFAALAQS
jgi:hypothetical protein